MAKEVTSYDGTCTDPTMRYPLIIVTYATEIKAGYTGAMSHSVNVS